MILMYHNIGPEKEFDTLSEEYFVQHLEYLKNSRREVVSLETYVDRLEQKRPMGDAVTITFDDAYVSIARFVLPLMKEYGYPFSVFVPVDHVGGINAWDAEGHPRPLKIMNWPELKTLSGEHLLTFGSHSLTHRSFGLLGENEIREELKESKERLERELPVKIRYFAFPFGQRKDLGVSTPALLKELGYRAALSTNWNRKNKIKQIYRLNRLEMNAHDDVTRLVRKMTRKPDLRAIKQNIKNLAARLKIISL